MVEENNTPGNETRPAKKPRPKLKRKQGQAKPVAAATSALDRVITNFSACARCSFFFTGYRALIEDEQVQQQLSQSDLTWLTLTWSHQVSALLQGSFGREITSDLVQYQLCCPECLRLYHYQSYESQPSSLRVQLDPQHR
ncbi:MAG: hypothetical protein IPL78_14185 [Chloroflexi bacterium]|nr:hypothetical protein [Chloroflexota bacterium]